MSTKYTDAGAKEKPGFTVVMGALQRPGVFWNVPVHLFILIPVTSFIAFFLARRIDRILGWEPFIHFPWNVLMFAILFPLGIFIVWYTYGYLAILGEGSPATHLGGTRNLVTTGPFAVCRHPSIVGKFSGVVALGFLVGSPTFMFIIIPLLTAYSLTTARFLQERLCETLWGDAYRAYRKSTPLVVPDPRRLNKLWTE